MHLSLIGLYMRGTIRQYYIIISFSSSLLLKIMVTLNASYVVKPAESIPNKVIYLSECDQVSPLAHVPTIYIYKTASTSPEFFKDAIHILKDSLSKALVTFFPLAGRLHWTNGGRFELHCNSMGGALLLEAESELKIDDLGDFLPNSPEILSLIPSVDYSSIPIHELPLFQVQLTKLSCGGISLGLATSHTVADGQSALHFISEWAKIARGENSNDYPFLDRTIIRANDDQSLQHSTSLKYSGFDPLPLLLGRFDCLEERRKPTKVIILRIDRHQIEKLKNNANQDIFLKSSNNNINRGFSRIEVISAHIWRCASKARMLKPDQETVLFVVVDFRNRLNPPLPPRYFGNAVMPVPVIASVEELLLKPLGYVAMKIRKAIENVNDEYVRSYLGCIKNIKDVSSCRQFHIVGPSQGLFYGNPNMFMSSWIRLSLYGANFGWGEEIYMGPASLFQDGRVFLISSHNEDGSFRFPIRLQEENISTFEKYFNEEIV